LGEEEKRGAKRAREKEARRDADARDRRKRDVEIQKVGWEGEIRR